MLTPELRAAAAARRFLLQGLWLQGTAPPNPADVAAALALALEIAAAGEPLPPLGFLADLTRLALASAAPVVAETPEHAVWPAGLVRGYEDHVVGKLAIDRSFERGADALRRFQGRDRTRALAYVVEQIRRRAGFGGAIINPALVKSLGQQDAGALIGQAWQSLETGGAMPVLLEVTAELLAGLRDCGDLLGPEDVFELEHGTALAPFGERVALRQVVQAAAYLEEGLPSQKPRALPRRQQAVTNLLIEDAYPVGGFASLSTRGSIESLLHSQLAFMERGERPDLFDIKFLRDELLYYSRDENQFLRRRRAFVFAFHPDLVHARVKDAALPYQRLSLALALTLAVVRKLRDWLGEHALTFELAFVTDQNETPLAAEVALVESAFREEIAGGIVAVTHRAPAELAHHCTNLARRAACHCVQFSTAPQQFDAENTLGAQVCVGHPLSLRPRGDDEGETEAVDTWLGITERLVRFLL